MKNKQELVDLPAVAGLPPRPNFIGKFAQQQWDFLIPRLEQMGILAETDSGVIASYCECFSRWEEATILINRYGILIPTVKDGVKKNPAITVAEEAQKMLRALAGELGLSPAARAKVKPLTNAKEPDKKKFIF